MTKIVFIRPQYHSVWEPLGLMYLSSYLKKYVGDLDINVFDRCFVSEKTVLDGCEGADFVGITGTTPQIKDMFVLANNIRKSFPKTHLIAGGYGPALQQELFRKSVFDTVIIGAGEKPLLDLIRSNKKGSETQFIKSFISDIENYTSADRTVVDSEKYISIAEKEEGRRVASVSGSRGCNSWCKFCADGHTNFWGNKYGSRNHKSVIDEVINIKEQFNLDFVKFADAEINPSKKNLFSLINQFSLNKNNVLWGANLRVDNIDEVLCNKLYDVGCREIWFGVESGDPKILLELNKGITTKQIKTAFKITEKRFVRRAYIMLGSQSESYETIKRTESLIDEINPDIIGVSLLCPYPGTAMFSEKHKYIDWSEMDEYSNPLASSKFLSNQELRYEQIRLLDKYSDKLAPIVRKKRLLEVIKYE